MNEDGVVSERQMLRAMLDFHPTVCEAFFAEQAILVEGDSETAILRFAREALLAITGEEHDTDNTTVVSCGGKWTIIPIARLLVKFGISCKVIHDMDKKGATAEELEAKSPIHPYKANSRIADLVGKANVYVVEDTLEDIMFPADEKQRNKDKPYSAWKRMQEILRNNELQDLDDLSNLFQFAFSHQ